MIFLYICLRVCDIHDSGSKIHHQTGIHALDEQADTVTVLMLVDQVLEFFHRVDIFTIDFDDKITFFDTGIGLC